MKCIDNVNVWRQLSSAFDCRTFIKIMKKRACRLYCDLCHLSFESYERYSSHASHRGHVVNEIQAGKASINNIELEDDDDVLQNVVLEDDWDSSDGENDECEGQSESSASLESDRESLFGRDSDVNGGDTYSTASDRPPFEMDDSTSDSTEDDSHDTDEELGADVFPFPSEIFFLLYCYAHNVTRPKVKIHEFK